MNNKIRKKSKFLLITFIILIMFVIIINSQISFGGINDVSSQINNMYVPLKTTLEKLDFNNIESNKNYMKFVKDDREFVFINEENYNLKKNNNTYYSKILNGLYFIKAAVLKDLGYKIDNDYTIVNNKDKLKLDIEYFFEYLKNNCIYSEEFNLSTSTLYYNHKIVKRNIDIKDLTDYTIEDNNIMGYNLKELEDYIKANYKITLKQYKKNLVSIDKKYPSYLRVTYQLLDNGQIIAIIVDSDNKTYIELVLEIKDKMFF